jgi:hypothetical protein
MAENHSTSASCAWRTFTTPTIYIHEDICMSEDQHDNAGRCTATTNTAVRAGFGAIVRYVSRRCVLEAHSNGNHQVELVDGRQIKVPRAKKTPKPFL